MESPVTTGRLRRFPVATMKRSQGMYYTQAVRLKPDWPEALNDLAWILATHPQAKIRNGPKAIRLAQRATQLTGGKVARFWATLDAAYAEASRFPDAVTAAEKSRELALIAGEKDIVQAADQRLILSRAPALSPAGPARPRESTPIETSRIVTGPSANSISQHRPSPMVILSSPKG